MSGAAGAPESGAGRRAGSARWLLGGALGVAAILSVLCKGYQFDGYFADDQFWNTLMIDRIHPGVLANDPLVQLIGGRYESGLFDLMVAIAPVVPLPVASLALFGVGRLLVCVAMYRLTRTATRSRAAGVIATFLLAGAPIGYLGGMNFVDSILTPRGFALSFGLFGLDAFLRRRMVATALWLGACLYIHPVSGVNILGTVVFCGVVFPDSAPRPRFWAALAGLAALMLAIAAWTGQLAGDAGPLRYDAAWAEVIADTVGPWVYLARSEPLVLLFGLWMPAVGLAAVACVGSGTLRTAYRRFALASLAAVALHAVAVDLLNVRPLLQLAPQRATVSLTALAVAAAALWIARSLRGPDPVLRTLGAALLGTAVLLRDPAIPLLFAALLALAWWLRTAAVAARWRTRSGVATVLAAASLAALVWPAMVASFQLKPAYAAANLMRVRALGVDGHWFALQQHIRRHSQVGDPVMAPPALSPRVFARRPSTLRTKMQSFTHVSRAFAFEYLKWRRDIGIPMQSADTAQAIALARRAGARWLVLDDREVPVAPNEPRPTVRAGPYRAYLLDRETGRRADDTRRS